MIGSIFDKLAPPTDNLYKFISFCGLLLIVLSFVPEYFLFRLTEQRIELTKNLSVFVLELKKFNEDSEKHISDLDKQITQVKNLTNKLDEDSDLLAKVKESLQQGNDVQAKSHYREFKENSEKEAKDRLEIDSLRKKIDENSQLLAEKKLLIGTKNAELDSTSRLIEFYDEGISAFRRASWIIFLIGLALAGFGFYQWYKKVQRLSDRALEIQARPIRRKRKRLI